MKCPNCGGQMGIEDAVCPYCNTPNTMAVQHQSDMARYRQEYQRTQESVMEKTSFLQTQGSWLVVLSILLVGLVAGVILLANSWDIGYSIRENNVERSAAEEGNITYTLNQDINNPRAFAMIEIWKDQDAIDKHNASEHFRTLVPKLGVMAEEKSIALYQEVEY